VERIKVVRPTATERSAREKIMTLRAPSVVRRKKQENEHPAAGTL
jgi:hypothetical protein